MRWTVPGIMGALVVGLSTAVAAAPPTCNGIPLLGTPEEIAATPRADVNLELLSVEMSGGLTASQETYDRVIWDIGRIRGRFPETAGIPYNGTLDGHQLYLAIDDATAAAIDAGTYSVWDCLNDYYELESVSRRSSPIGEFATLSLEGIYNTFHLVPLYEQLPGVIYASGLSGGFHRGRTICGLVDSSSTHHYFIVVDAFGDCPSGCIYRDVRYFTSSGTRASPRFRGRWANFEEGPRPPWVDVYFMCAYGPTHPLQARIDAVPGSPDIGEAVVLKISGEDGNSTCGPFFDHVETDSVANTIRVTADYNAGCGTCPPDVSPYSFDVDPGPLLGGEYMVTYFTRTWSSSHGICGSRDELHGLTQLFVGAPATPIPVLSPMGLSLLFALLVGAALVVLRRQRWSHGPRMRRTNTE